MKRLLVIVLALIMVVTVVGCGSKDNDQKDPVTPPPSTAGPTASGDLADGYYYAEGEFGGSGWKDVVAIRVEGNKIVDVNWNALHQDGGLDKKMSSETGEYGMVAKGNSQSEWHEQVAIMENLLIEQQTLADVKLNDDGKPDAISGVSITVNGFTELVNKALAAGPVTPGAYKDGTYYAEADAFDEKSGWKENVHITVINGDIAAVSWNGVHKDGGTDKVARSKSGEYAMVQYGNAQAEWHEQAYNAEQFLIEKQDVGAILYGDNGKTDAISGVSITVNGFAELAAEALADPNKH